MTIDDQIKHEKLQYDINREATKISALSSGKINKYDNLRDEEILPSNQKQMILILLWENKILILQIKTIEDQGEKQIDDLKTLNPKELEPTIDSKSDDNKKLFEELSNERISEIYNMS